MKIVINISKYDRDWIRNAYEIPAGINTIIAEAIINGETEDEDDNAKIESGSIPRIRLINALSKIIMHEPEGIEEAIKLKAYIEAFRWILGEEDSDEVPFD